MKKIVLATVLAAGMATSASAQGPLAFGTLGGAGATIEGVLTTLVVLAAETSGSSTTTTH